MSVNRLINLKGRLRAEYELKNADADFQGLLSVIKLQGLL
jgi:hypothetical protein